MQSGRTRARVGTVRRRGAAKGRCGAKKDPADFGAAQVGPQCQQLAAAAQAARAQAGAGRQVVQPRPAAGDKHVAHVFALGRGDDFEIGVDFGG